MSRDILQEVQPSQLLNKDNIRMAVQRSRQGLPEFHRKEELLDFRLDIKHTVEKGEAIPETF